MTPPDRDPTVEAAPRPPDPRLERAYTILISATPALRQAWIRSVTGTAARLNALLHDAAVDWCLDYQAATGRGDQGLERIEKLEAHRG